ncbi:hypothetical protein, partial [Streptomyces sp. NPDC059900]|uniref:hypothetical protein n=1 Tax=Streptomyces sp. NPDC059900 TaxID=3155816 RepID=UPI003CFEC79F
MLSEIGQQAAAAAHRDIEKPVVKRAFFGRREFPVSAYDPCPELLARLVESITREVGAQARQTGWYGYVFRLDLTVPQ